MLLLEHPQRLSTDIDIIVEPRTNVEEYIEKASKIFPLVRYEEQRRVGKNNIEKRHFKFTYDSPVNGKELYILLDAEIIRIGNILIKPQVNEALIKEYIQFS